MFGKLIIVAGAVAALGSLSLATNASAGGRGGQGQRPTYTVKNGNLNLGGKPPSNYTSARGAPGSATTNNGNFGAHGPYIGMKWIGNVP